MEQCYEEPSADSLRAIKQGQDSYSREDGGDPSPRHLEVLRWSTVRPVTLAVRRILDRPFTMVVLPLAAFGSLAFLPESPWTGALFLLLLPWVYGAVAHHTYNLAAGEEAGLLGSLAAALPRVFRLWALFLISIPGNLVAGLVGCGTMGAVGAWVGPHGWWRLALPTKAAVVAVILVAFWAACRVAMAIVFAVASGAVEDRGVRGSLREGWATAARAPVANAFLYTGVIVAMNLVGHATLIPAIRFAATEALARGVPATTVAAAVGGVGYAVFPIQVSLLVVAVTHRFLYEQERRRAAR